MNQPRPSPIAGTWYPGSPEALARSVDAQLAGATSVRPAGDLVALIVPHAGHRYSGAVACQAFHLLHGISVETVVVISPMHHPYPGRILTSAHPAYQTPLGDVAIDGEMLDAVEAALPAGLRLERVAQDAEHSLEIELPFLQRASPDPSGLCR